MLSFEQQKIEIINNIHSIIFIILENVQISYDACLGRGLVKPSEYRHMWGVG